MIGGSNALTPIGRSSPAGQRVTNSFSGEIDNVAIYSGQALDQTQVQGLMTNGPRHVSAGLVGAGLSGGLADYTFAYVNGVLQATDHRPATPTTTQIFGVGTISFGDGTIAFVLNSGSPNTPNLTLTQAQTMAPNGHLVVIGNGNQIVQLIKPSSGVEWTAGAAQTIGQSQFVPWTTGSTTVLVIQGQPARDPVAPLPAPPAEFGAVALEQVDPAQLMSLIQGSSIQIPVKTVASTDAAQTLLFDEQTGALVLTVDNAALSTTEPSLLVDSLGEEWMLLPAGGVPPTLIEISGAISTRNGW